MRLRFALVSAMAAASVPTSGAVHAAGPFIANDRIVFPEGGDVPRGMTDVERQFLREHPELALQASATAPPTGPVVCPGEYGPMQGIILAWEGYASVVTAMAVNITTIGQADAYIMCDSQSEANSVISTLTSAGANMSRVFTYVVTTDTVWIRDYGPRYIYEGGCRAIVDHTYNRPRPNDNNLPTFWSSVTGHRRYVIPLIHGGGNYHLDSVGTSWATQLIDNENPSLTENQIKTYWNQYQGVNTTITSPFPTSVDSTQHIDMWMQIIDDDNVVISDWPAATPQNPLVQDNICDSVAASMAGLGFTVTRVPAYSVGGTHYTYTNVTMCNNLILLPTYTNSTIVNQNANAVALAAWQAAAPGKTIVQVPCQSIVVNAGVMHCICMHVPVNLNGANPTAYLRQPRGGEVLDPGTQFEIQWISDDDVDVSNVDILLSTDGGATFPTVIASATADDGSFVWSVPNVYSNSAIVKVVARDAQGNTGSDQSPSVFTLNAPPPSCPGDADASNFVDFGDITAAIANWGASPGTPFDNGDANGDGFVDFDDITETLANWGASCP